MYIHFDLKLRGKLKKKKKNIYMDKSFLQCNYIFMYWVILINNIL